MTDAIARLRVPLLVVAGFVAGALVVLLTVLLLPDDTGDDAEAGSSAVASQAVSPTPALTPAPTREPPKRDPPYSYVGLPAGARLEHVATGIDGPTSLDGTIDGRIFVTEQFTGAVRVVFGGVLLKKPFYVVPDLHIEAEPGFVTELGLVGIILEPKEQGKHLSMLLYYSAESGGKRMTKLVRVRDDGKGNGVYESTLLEIPLTPICCHIGGSLAWMTDGTLLVGVGDHDANGDAQKLDSIVGKILRITKTGEAPSDNPFVKTPGADPRIYAYGLRNPFGVAVDPQGPTYLVDNGHVGYDTVHVLRPGANYGWPSSSLAEGATVETPMITYYESLGLAGMAVYRGKLAEFDGDLFYCQFHRGGALHWYPMTDDPFEYDRIVSGGCSSNVRMFPDGNLYMLDYFTGSVLRIAAR